MEFTHFLTAILLYLKVNFGNSDEGFFWQLTDVHYDPWYETRQESCGEDLQDPGKFGNFNCHPPWVLVKSSVNAMKSIEGGANADFILWSGDNPSHVKNLSLFHTDKVLEVTQNITDIIVKEFPGTLVVPVIGNHDYFPKHQLPGENNALYNGLADMWSDWLDTADMQDTFRQGAYFTSTLSESPKVRAVILNTNLYFILNKATEGQEDPGGQFAWLEKVLNKSRHDGEKVYLFDHVPIGKASSFGGGHGSLTPAGNAKLLDILTSYMDIIIGSFSAHIHQDTFKIFYNEMGEPVTGMYISPSVTPWKLRVGDWIGPPHNPALRRYIFDRSTYELIDIQQYYLDLVMANSLMKAEWKFLYSFKETYNLHNISAGEIHRLLQEMKKHNSESFDTFFDLNTVKVDEEEMTCNCECKTIHLCSIEYLDYEEFDKCHKRNASCQQDGEDMANKANPEHCQGFVQIVIYYGLLMYLTKKLF